MGRWVAVLLAAQLSWPALAAGQGAPAPAPPAAAPAPPTGNPGNPADPGNPHPTMPWFGPATPYGQFVRWVWMPPQPVVVNDELVYEPGFWLRQTTAGYYYPRRWVLREVGPGIVGWVLLDGGAVPFAR